jgi:hypothetical protein
MARNVYKTRMYEGFMRFCLPFSAVANHRKAQDDFDRATAEDAAKISAGK